MIIELFVVTYKKIEKIFLSCELNTAIPRFFPYKKLGILLWMFQAEQVYKRFFLQPSYSHLCLQLSVAIKVPLKMMDNLENCQISEKCFEQLTCTCSSWRLMLRIYHLHILFKLDPELLLTDARSCGFEYPIQSDPEAISLETFPGIKML